MRKRFQTFLMLVIFTVFLSAGYTIQRCATMLNRGLIEEVFSLGRPEPRLRKSINEIVTKYVPVGTSRRKTEEILFSAGFYLKGEKLTPLLERQSIGEDFKDCEELLLRAVYARRPWFYLDDREWFYLYRDMIMISIGFKRGRAAVCRTWYLRTGFP